MIEIIPAILATTKEEFTATLHKLESITDRVHIDIVDGVFLPNKTVDGYPELQSLATNLKFDVHLMVQDPTSVVPNWFPIEQADRFLIHIESQGDHGELFKNISDHNRRSCLVLNPETQSGMVLPYLDLVHCVQFMTVHPGKQGAPFESSVLHKMGTFHTQFPNITIAADGGINPETAVEVAKAGATMLVSGSYIVQNDNQRKAIAHLREAVEPFL